ncbi:major capsid protein [Pseudescherichia vulneris]|uniref:major capsid protein n=1 Tax=Pseudescherichia vulneris TaxID=566 RepID=UPI001EDFB06E|nr:major capsid protein [Pseudescherichia vulneris]
MAFPYSAYGMADLVPLFEVAPSENYLLQNLNIFDATPSNSIRVMIDKLVEDNKTLINNPKKRYAPEHDSTVRNGGETYFLELLHFHREDMVSAKDFQDSSRKPGTQREYEMVDIVSDYVMKHAKAHKRTLESMYARALFLGQVETPFTAEAPLINYTQSFNAPYMTNTIKLSDTSTDALEVFNGFLDQVSTATDGLWSDVRRVVVFAGAEFYNSLRFHASMKSAYQFVDPFSDMNIVYQRKDLLPNVQTFSLPGLSVDVVKVTDPLITPFIASNSAVMLPIFKNDTGVFSQIYGPASVDTNLARSGQIQEYYSYQYEKPRGEVEVVSEASILPVNHGTAFTLKITAS